MAKCIVDFHVIQTAKGNWGVFRGENRRPTKVVQTQRDAIQIARQMAKDSQSDMFIYNINGNVRRHTSYRALKTT